MEKDGKTDGKRKAEEERGTLYYPPLARIPYKDNEMLLNESSAVQRG